MNKKVAIVTGASSGIGYDAAILLQEHGWIVYGAARRLDRLKQLESKGIKVVQLDVTNEASMVACVNHIETQEGRIDVLVNNAGYGSYGALEEVSMDEAKRQMDVNVFGLIRMSQLVLPIMRKNHFGRIINISSMGGKVYTIFGGWYHATKFAVEALSDCMRLEVKDFGVDVVVIEPGGIKTDWGFIAADYLEETSADGVYATRAKESAQAMRKMYASKYFSDPIIIAKAILKAATVKKPKTRYLIGFGAKPSIFIRRLVPDRVFDLIARRL